MKKIVIVILSFWSFLARGQNLLLNSGFEDTVSCPTQLGQLTYAMHWYGDDAVSTSDFFHRCSQSLAPPVISSFINQETYHGDGYMGLILHTFFDTDTAYNYSEISSTRLINPTEKGKFYCFSGYVNLADMAGYRSSALHVLLSNDSLPPLPLPERFPKLPDLQMNILAVDTQYWHSVKGGFIADDDYRFFHLGNFFRRSDYVYEIWMADFPSSVSPASYYLFDSLSFIRLDEPVLSYAFSCETGAFSASVSGADSVRWYRNGQLFSQQSSILLADIQSGESLMAEHFLCNYTFIDTVTVPPCTVPEPEFPNIITPNGDGINDAFTIQHLPPGSSLIIYNRWGNEVFRTAHYNNTWQGTTETLGNETKLSDGTYFYVLVTQEGKQYKGTITIGR